MKHKIIYQLTTEDIYTVVEESLDRKPTKDELKFVEEKIGDYIDWYDAIDTILMRYEPPKKK